MARKLTSVNRCLDVTFKKEKKTTADPGRRLYLQICPDVNRRRGGLSKKRFATNVLATNVLAADSVGSRSPLRFFRGVSILNIPSPRTHQTGVCGTAFVAPSNFKFRDPPEISISSSAWSRSAAFKRPSPFRVMLN